MGKQKNKFIGPASFYRLVASISVPLILQQLVQNTLGAVDTAMVGKIGGVAAVSVAAQVESIMNMVAFGVSAGVAIYAAQYFGARNIKELKKSFGLQLMLNMITGILFVLVAIFFGEVILRFYSPIDGIEEITQQGLQYLKYAMLSYIPATIGFAFAYMYRNIQKTVPPLIISTIVMLTNIVLNYCLIFGHFGFPNMGVEGAALATAIATTVGLIAHIVYAYASKQPFMGTPKEMFGFDLKFAMPILIKSLPILFNEFLFGFGMTLYMKAYGLIGRESLESYKIGSTVAMFFFPIVTGVNGAVGALLGNELGKKNLKKAKEYGRYFIFICFVMAVAVGALVIISAQLLVPLFFEANADPNLVKSTILLTQLFSFRIGIRLFNSFFFSSLRAGGDANFLLFLDGGIMWIFGIPVCFIAVQQFGVNSVPLLFAINQIEQIIRLIIGSIRFKSGRWLKTLVDN